MLAATFQGVERIAVIEKPEPAILEPTDAIVEIEISGLCGSDLHPWSGREKGIDAGTTMGHERRAVGGTPGRREREDERRQERRVPSVSHRSLLDVGGPPTHSRRPLRRSQAASRQSPAASRQPPAASRQPPVASRQSPAASRQPPAASRQPGPGGSHLSSEGGRISQPRRSRRGASPDELGAAPRRRGGGRHKPPRPGAKPRRRSGAGAKLVPKLPPPRRRPRRARKGSLGRRPSASRWDSRISRSPSPEKARVNR